jgi:hypothetical protein
MNPIPAACRLLETSLTPFTFISDDTRGPIDGSFTLLAHAGSALRAGRLCVLITCYNDAAHWRASLRRFLGAESSGVAVIELSEVPGVGGDVETAATRAQVLIDYALAAAAKVAAAPGRRMGDENTEAAAWIGIDDVFGLVDNWGLAMGSSTLLALPAVIAKTSIIVSARASPGIDWAIDLGAGPLFSVGLREALCERALGGVLFVESLAMGGGDKGAQGRLRWMPKLNNIPTSSSSSSNNALFRITIDGSAVDGA